MSRMYNTISNRNRLRVSLCPISRWYLSLFSFCLRVANTHRQRRGFRFAGPLLFRRTNTHTLLGYWRDTVRASCLILCCPQFRDCERRTTGRPIRSRLDRRELCQPPAYYLPVGALPPARWVLSIALLSVRAPRDRQRRYWRSAGRFRDCVPVLSARSLWGQSFPP